MSRNWRKILSWKQQYPVRVGGTYLWKHCRNTVTVDEICEYSPEKVAGRNNMQSSDEPLEGTIVLYHWSDGLGDCVRTLKSFYEPGMKEIS